MIAAAIIGSGAGYAAGRSVLDALLHELGYTGAQYLPLDQPAAIPGRAAGIHLRTRDEQGRPLLPFGMSDLAKDGTAELGQLFEVHPGVLEEWKLSAPVVLLSLVLGVNEWG
jgi:phenylalanyl-tRNA synthetase beta subunit